MFKSNYYQILTVFSCTIGSIADGMADAWTSPYVPVLLSPNSPIKINQSGIFWLEYITLIGGICVIPFVSCFSNRIGRKKVILCATTLNILGWIIVATSRTLLMLCVGRFITGFGATTFILAPMYIAEIADESIRGFFAAWVYLMMLIGFMIIYSIGPFVSIFISSTVAIIVLLIQLIAFSNMPESPYYLLLKEKDVDAKKALQRLRSHDEVEEELNEILLAVQRQQAEGSKIWDLVLDKGNRKSLIILILLNWGQQFSGNTVILMNLQSILNVAVDGSAATVTTIGFTVVMLVAAVTGALAVDKVGRKPLMFVSSFLTGLSLLLLATYFLLQSTYDSVQMYNWIPLVLCVVYAGAYMSGLGIIPIVALGELFPIQVKQMGMPIVDLSFCVFAILSVILYSQLLRFGVYISLYIFGVCATIIAFVIYFYMPETKGKTLEEVQLLLKGKVQNEYGRL